MSRKPRSLKQVQAQLSDQMRNQGSSWAQVGLEFQHRFHVNARVALRQARGWTQPDAADRWNRCWPDDPKTFKSFSYWEAWPSATGYAPSLEVLDRLARLYECSVADLVSDLDDYGAPRRPRFSAVRDRPRDPASAAAAAVAAVAAVVEKPDTSPYGAPLGAGLGAMLPNPGAVQGFSRRKALMEMSSAFAVAAAAPLLERAPFSGDMGRIDKAVVANTELIVDGLRKQNAALGPATTLQTGMALRAMMESVVKGAPESVKTDAWTVYGDLSQLIGWMMFNLGEDASAKYYYDDARKAAYEANDYELASNVLAATAQLSLNGPDWRDAIDHAQAAEEAARRSGSERAMGYAADTVARAYASAGQVARCQSALERERKLIGKIDWVEPAALRWGFYRPSFYWSRESECALLLGMPVEAADAATLSHAKSDPAYLHNIAMTLARRAEAQALMGDSGEACRTLNEAGRMTTLVGSVRLARQIARVRRELRPYDGTAAVLALDARLAKYRQSGGHNTGPSTTPDLARLDVT